MLPYAICKANVFVYCLCVKYFIRSGVSLLLQMTGLLNNCLLWTLVPLLPTPKITHTHTHTHTHSKLINLSVRNTVDLRALTKISASMSAAQRAESLQDNMTLVIESARAIGCRVEEDSIEKILEKNPQTIRDFLVDLIRVSGCVGNMLEPHPQ